MFWKTLSILCLAAAMVTTGCLPGETSSLPTASVPKTSALAFSASSLQTTGALYSATVTENEDDQQSALGPNQGFSTSAEPSAPLQNTRRGISTETFPTPYGRSILSPSQQLFYDALADKAALLTPGIILSLPVSLPAQAVRETTKMLILDDPALYWLEVALPDAEEATSVSWVRLNSRYTVSAATLRQERLALAQWAEAITQNLPEHPIDQITALHDRIAQSFTYHSAPLSSREATLAASLPRGSAICEGYVRAFQYAAQHLGFPCFTITGQSLRQIPHAWNAVFVQGDWRYVDVTWDDSDNADMPVYYDYLLTSQSQLHDTHFPDIDWASLPASRHPANSYYARHGLVLDAAVPHAAQAMSAMLLPQLAQGGGVFYRGESVLFTFWLDGSPETCQTFLRQVQPALFTLRQTLSSAGKKLSPPIFLASSGALEYNYNPYSGVFSLSLTRRSM